MWLFRRESHSVPHHSREKHGCGSRGRGGEALGAISQSQVRCPVVAAVDGGFKHRKHDFERSRPPARTVYLRTVLKTRCLLKRRASAASTTSTSPPFLVVLLPPSSAHCARPLHICTGFCCLDDCLCNSLAGVHAFSRRVLSHGSPTPSALAPQTRYLVHIKSPGRADLHLAPSHVKAKAKALPSESAGPIRLSTTHQTSKSKRPLLHADCLSRHPKLSHHNNSLWASGTCRSPLTRRPRLRSAARNASPSETYPSPSERVLVIDSQYHPADTLDLLPITHRHRRLLSLHLW
jgi:hypothetical protein